jgi:hypothetical protein
MRLTAATSALLALAAIAPASAPAAATTPIPSAPVNGPVVANGEAVWAAARPDEGFDLLAARPGGPHRAVQSFPSYQDSTGHDVALTPQLSAAGPKIALAVDAYPIAFDRYDDEIYPAGSDVLTGTADAPLQTVFQCRPGLGYGVTAAAADGGIVVSGPDCEAAHASALAFRSDGGDMRPLTPRGTRARAAGAFAGWIDRDGDIVVYDLAGAAVAYRIDLPAGSQVIDWDLQTDGKVVAAVAPGVYEKGSAAWYSRDEPTAHPLPLPPARVWNLRIAADRIAYLRFEGAGSPYYLAELGTSDLAGHTRTVADRAIGVEQSHPAFAFDGTNVTWAAPACSGAVLHSQTVDEAPVSGPRPRCPQVFRSRPRPLGKIAIRVPLRCTGFVLPDCGGSTVRLETAKGHVLLGRGDSRYCDLTADVVIWRRARALVRKVRTLRVHATVSATDAAGAREVRTATFTLRARDRITTTSACEDDF